MTSIVKNGEETESDDEDEFIAHEARKKTLKEMTPNVIKENRRSLRRRTMNQLIKLHSVPANGHCLYIAVLRASRAAQLLPGIMFRQKCWKSNVASLRKYMVKKLGTENGAPNTKNFLTEANIMDETVKRIEFGVGNNNKAKDSVASDWWAGEIEIRLIEECFQLNIAVLEKTDAEQLTTFTGTEITRDGIIITRVNGNHYEWASVNNWTTLINSTPARIKIKF